MLLVRNEWLCIAILTFSLSGATFAQIPSSSGQATPSPSVEASPLQKLIERLLAAKTEDEKKALLTAEKGLATKELVQALNRQGDRLQAQRSYAEAEIHYRLAQETAEHINDQTGLAAALNGLGLINRIQSRFSLAKEHYEKALAIRKTLKDKPGLIQTYRNLGITFYLQGNYDKALEFYQESLALAEETDNQAAIADSLFVIGDAYRLRGRINRVPGSLELALNSYHRALAIRESSGNQAGVASLLLNIGLVHVTQRNDEKATEAFQKSLSLRETLGGKSALAATWEAIGDAYMVDVRPIVAAEAYQKSLKLREELKDQAGTASSLNKLASTYSQQNKLGEALAYFEKSASLSKQLGNQSSLAATLNLIGHLYLRQGNLQAAIGAFQQSTAVYKSLNDQRNAARMMVNVSVILESQGQTKVAVEMFQQVLALLTSAEDKAPVAQYLQNSGSAYQARGKINLASIYYEKSQVLLESVGDERLLSLLYRQIGDNYLNLSYSRALDYYGKSLALTELLKDKTEMAVALQRIGGALISQGSYQQALDYVRRSLAFGEELGDRRGIAEGINNLGNIFNMQGNFGLALQHYQTALARLEAPGSKEFDHDHWIIIVLRNIGEMHMKLGNNGLALEHLQRSLKLRETLGGNQAINTYHYLNIGEVYQRQGEHKLALEYYNKGVSHAESLGSLHHLPHALLSVGKFYLSQGNHAAALEALQRGLKLYEESGKHLDAVNALNLIAKVYYDKGDYAQAADTAGRAVERAKQTDQSKVLWQSLTSAGSARRALGQIPQARVAFDEAIAVVEAMRGEVVGGETAQQQFFEDKLAPYHAQISLLTTEGRAEEALSYAERAKARTLLDVLHDGQANISQAMTAQEQQQEQDFITELVALNSEIKAQNQLQKSEQVRLTELKGSLQKARQAYEGFLSGLYLAHPQLKAKRGEAPPLKLDEVATLLPIAKAALLEYVVTEENVLLFVVTGGGAKTTASVKVYPLAIKASDLTAQLQQFRQSLAKRDPGFGAAAQSLYDLLLKPAQKQLRGKETLVIVPDGALWELPFQALQSAPTRYLIQEFAISYVPSLTVLREMRTARPKPVSRPDTLLAFGNPTLGKQTVTSAKTVLMDEKFEPLPDAETQVKKLGQIYGPHRSNVYVGAEAHEKRVKAEAAQHRILHLATHGVLNDASPMYSHLLLAQTGEPGKEASEAREDGLLEAWELMKLDLNADLVVLSACETARGRVGAGEGVIGLTWALFVAGCPRTVVSQWKVESASTTELMIEFHRQLKLRMQKSSGKLGAAQSLRMAALKMLRSGQYCHPFWWAGFVVVGDGF